MILRTVEKEALIPFLASKSSVFAVKEQAMLEIYGEDCDFWFQTDAFGVNCLLISRLSDTLTLCGETSMAMLPELRAFLDCMGGTVEGDGSVMETLFPALEYLPVLSAPEQVSVPPPKGVRITVPEQLAPVYHLLADADASFKARSQYGPWLADFSHRCRHGYTQCFVLLEENELIGTFSILFQTEDKALGGALAVRPDRRKQGYGGLLLREAAAAAKKEGRKLYVFANAARRGYYLRHGWQECGMAAQFHLNSDE